jgi:hypothetical protein
MSIAIAIASEPTAKASQQKNDPQDDEDISKGHALKFP